MTWLAVGLWLLALFCTFIAGMGAAWDYAEPGSMRWKRVVPFFAASPLLAGLAFEVLLRA